MTEKVEADKALSRSFHADSGGGSQQLHVELGATKALVIMLWLSSFVSAAAVIGLVMAILSYNNGVRSFNAQLQQTSAHVNVLQYDLAQLKAQLIEKGYYEQTGH